MRKIVARHERPVRRELGREFRVGGLAVVHFWTFCWRLCDRAGCETEFFLLAAFIGGHVGGGDTFHTEDFDLVTISAR